MRTLQEPRANRAHYALRSVDTFTTAERFRQSGVHNRTQEQREGTRSRLSEIIDLELLVETWHEEVAKNTLESRARAGEISAQILVTLVDIISNGDWTEVVEAQVREIIGHQANHYIRLLETRITRQKTAQNDQE